MPSIPDAAYQAAYRAGFAAARVVWRLRRPAHSGALVAVHVGPEILLVRQSYRAEYTLPGGGLRAGESAIDAARRELREELHLELRAADLTKVFERTELWDYRRDTVHFFRYRAERRPALRVDNRELVDTLYVTPEAARGLQLTGPASCYFESL